MSYFRAKMHQIQFRLGLCPKPHWGSSQRSPDHLTTLCLKKNPDTYDIFKYLQQISTDINNFWYRESPLNQQSSDTKLACEIS